MQRLFTDPRPGWRATVESQGLVFSTTTRPDGTEVPYWYESAYYALTADEVDALEEATAELHRLCLAAVAHVVRTNGFAGFGITDARVKEAIRRSWHERAPSVYGRFDLAYDGVGGAPKMLEYNADTPAGLLESAICQWCYQQYTPLPDYGGNRPVLGSWIVAGEPAGLGIRESDGPVTDYYARFVPHVISAD